MDTNDKNIIILIIRSYPDESLASHFNPGFGIILVPVIVTFIIALIVVGFQSMKAAMANPVDSLRHE